MTKRYSVSYEIITDESSRYGDAEEHGIISESDYLRDAIEDLLGGSGGVEAIELRNDCNYRIITAYYGYNKSTGDFEERSLCFNNDVSLSSRKRIFKLMERSI